ncbi:diguanylate cyclase domain-containing protein [Rheinheimera sp. MMS21-TC3]|uniref:TackOD1 domain-containing metal-binding protein n=1 Tax=Rheinheimera sp. MMS21-TC3 TaxID=3072790 RepID=UPI0028C4756D|nr:diguanylate cyclase [Rheinheimera sp. MMS21-TC3]WNO59646.1 diguanylate cyclase [Rheinheimera sp. MMS21-TC3]
MKKNPVQLVFAETNTALLQEKVTFADLEQINWQQVSYLVLDATDISSAYSALVKLRQHRWPQIYLRPVVFVSLKDKHETWQWQAADAVIAPNGEGQIEWQVLPDRLESINSWIDSLAKLDGADDCHLPVRILRILASRKIDADPIATSDIPSGYTYPILQPLFTLQDMGPIHMLAYLQEQKLLSPTLFDRAHFCIHCDSAFLNFKETCVECGSHDLDIVELVHHFKCAFTADITRFKRGSDSLVCPKCDKHLRHIGVDYDKPSVVNKCRVCQHVGQDANVVAKCFNCSCTTESRFLDLRRINNYKITSVGLNAAFYGLQTYFTNILEQELALVALREFEFITNIEAARISRYGKSQSALAIVRFVGLDKIHFELGSKAKQVFFELANIFKGILRETDVITAYNESMFVILMTETSKEKADLALDRLKKAIEQLFNENFAQTLNMQIKAINVEPNLKVRQILEEFLNS